VAPILTGTSAAQLAARREGGCPYADSPIWCRILCNTDLAAASNLAHANEIQKVQPHAPHPAAAPQIEVAHLLHFYHERGLVEAPSAAQVEKLRAITNGSGSDLRRLGLRSAQLDTNVL
jgi:hypothetical protein